MSKSVYEAHSSFRPSYPFDNSNGTHADMILRSSDGVDFRVMKGVLAVSSPIFQDMTALAKPLASEGKRTSADVSEDGLPIVTMYESNATVLDALLHILYPLVPPELDDLGLVSVSNLLRVAQKYDMAIVLRVLENTLRNAAREKNGERSLEVYVLAWEYRLEDVLRVAVTSFLKCPVNQAYFAALEKVPASAVFHLFEYRRRVADKIDPLFAPVNTCQLPQQLRCLARDIECSMRNIKPADGCGSNESGHHISSWWVTLRESARSDVQKAPLLDDAISIGTISGAACSAKCCSGCREKVFRQLPALEASIKQEIRKFAEEVTFDLPW